MILTDGVHLISDESLEELHKFALKIGLKRCWFQGGSRRHPHYDLTSQRKLTKAIVQGAKAVTTKQLIRASLARMEEQENE